MSDYKIGRLPKAFRNGKVFLRKIIREEDCQRFLGLGRYYYVRL